MARTTIREMQDKLDVALDDVVRLKADIYTVTQELMRGKSTVEDQSKDLVRRAEGLKDIDMICQTARCLFHEKQNPGTYDPNAGVHYPAPSAPLEFDPPTVETMAMSKIIDRIRDRSNAALQSLSSMNTLGTTYR